MRFVRFHLIFVSCCVLTAMLAAGARAQYQVEYWTTDDQLPQNTVSAVRQTRDGYLWLATLDGLARYNGSRFQVFNKANSDGIRSNRFTALVEDGNGDLWAATESSGVTRYRDRRFESFSTADGLPHNTIADLFVDAEGRVTVVTVAGTVRWQGERFAPDAATLLTDGPSIIHAGQNGALWVMREGVVRRTANGETTEFTLPPEVFAARVNEMLEDSRGRLWIGTNRLGLFVLENGKLTAFPLDRKLTENHVTPLLEDREGNIWVTAQNNGAAVLGPDGALQWLTAAQGLSENNVSVAHEDREGNIWLGTYYRGLNRVNRQTVRFYGTRDGLRADIVHPIFESRDGSVWIGGKNLTRYRDGRFEAVSDARPSIEVTAIEEDRAGRVWFGFWNGIYYYENGRFVDFAPRLGHTASFWDIHETADGALWFATEKGLVYHRDGRTRVLTTDDGLPSNDVKVIHESPDGRLWFGTAGGLAFLDEEKRRRGEEEKRSAGEKVIPAASAVSSSPLPLFSFSAFTSADGLASDLVRAIYEDADGVLWLGSYDGGLTRLKDGRFTAFTSANGLFNDGVFQILEDARGNLWMSCNRGIYRVAKRELNDFADGRATRITSVAIGKTDGLLETECNGGQQPAGIRARDGRLWFPTQKGVAVIDPDRLAINPNAPPVVIESFALDGQPSDAVGDEITVAPNVQNLEIDYAALSFIKPEQVRFRYRMSGLSEDWIDTGARRTAYFSYLPPGEYTFTVIAANADDVWNTTGKTVRVRVVPPFYRTWWFTALAVLLVAGAVLFLYRRREEQFAREKLQQEMFSRRLIESQERERGRIAAELHDGLSQSLVIIKNRAQLSLARPDDADGAFEQLEEISDAASDAMLEAKEIIYNLRPIQLDRFGLTKAVKSMLKRVGETHGLEFETEIEPLDNTLSPEAESNLYRILQESVNNIIRHSGATGASVALVRRDRFVRLTVADNGRGFAAGQSRRGDGGFGLLGIVERAKLLHGHAEIESTPGEGTTVRVVLPVETVR